MYYEIGRLAIGLICHGSVMYLLYDIDTICRPASFNCLLHLLIALDACLCVITQIYLVDDIEIA